MEYSAIIVMALGFILVPAGISAIPGITEDLPGEKVVFEDGSSYTGHMIGGKKTGSGIYVWADGAEYRGEFKDGEPDGEGLYLYADGRRKRVRYKKGVMMSAAPVSNAEQIDGAEYGEFDCNGHYSGWFRGNKLRGYVPHGRGVMRYVNGSVYTGQWLNGRMHGNGVIRWEDGAVYSGQWVNGKRTGNGSYTWRTGDTYVGQWKENQMCGQGTYYHSNGNIEKGIWQEKTVHLKKVSSN